MSVVNIMQVQLLKPLDTHKSSKECGWVDGVAIWLQEKSLHIFKCVGDGMGGEWLV